MAAAERNLKEKRGKTFFFLRNGEFVLLLELVGSGGAAGIVLLVGAPGGAEEIEEVELLGEPRKKNSREIHSGFSDKYPRYRNITIYKEIRFRQRQTQIDSKKRKYLKFEKRETDIF